MKRLRIGSAGLTRIQAVFLVILVVAAAIAGAYAWQTFYPAQPAREILIGSSMSLTGVFSTSSEEAKWAYEYAVDQVNKAGGIDIDGMGKLKVRLIVYDDKGDPNAVINNVNRLITVDKVDFLLGCMGTHLVSAAAGEAEKLQVPLITAGTSSLAIRQRGFKYTFIYYETVDQEVGILFEMVSQLPQDLRPRTVAVWAENSALGKEFGEQANLLAPKYGLEVVLNEGYSSGATDFTDLITKTKSLSPDLVMGIPVIPDAITLIRQSKDLALKPKLFYMPRGAPSIAFLNALGQAAHGVTWGQCWSPDQEWPGNKEVAEAYGKAGFDPYTSGAVGPFYAVAQVLLDAIMTARSLDRERVTEVLLEKTFSTVSGSVKFNENRVAGIEMIVFQWQGGLIKTVYPPKFATGKLIYPGQT